MTSGELDLITLHLDFKKGEADPSKVFLAMRDMIQALESSDQVLAKGFQVKLTQELLLEDIQAGSLKVILAQKVHVLMDAVPEDVLASGDPKKIVGNFLVKGKHKLASYIQDKTGVGSSSEITELGRELQTIATETGMGLIPTYEPPSSRELLGVLQLLSHATQELRDGDTIDLSTPQGSVTLNPKFVVTDADVTRLLTREVITNPGLEQILRVRKPDFLGGAQWEFRWAYGTLLARVEDRDWIERFHRQEEVIRPGDSLRVLMDSTTHFGHDGAAIESHHVIRTVIEIIRGEWTPPVPLAEV